MKKDLFKLSSIALISIILFSCNKSKDCSVNIKCKDTNGSNVQNATVKLYANVQTDANKKPIIADLKASGQTDSEGRSSFIFKLPAIYNVDVTSGNKTATGIVKLEEGKTVTEEIIVK